jgi:hypothetical protein
LATARSDVLEMIDVDLKKHQWSRIATSEMALEHVAEPVSIQRTSERVTRRQIRKLAGQPCIFELVVFVF